jgi:hypothetical protein
MGGSSEKRFPYECQAKQVVRASLNLQKAHRLRLNPHPPSFEGQPWFHTMVRVDSPPANLTKITLFNAITSQLQLGFTAGCDVRLISARFWGAIPSGNTSGIPQPVQIRLKDPLSLTSAASSNNTDTQIVLIDYPDMVNRACVGYKFSRSQQAAVINLAIGDTNTLAGTTGMGANSVAYFELLWRSGANSLPNIGPAIVEVEPSAPPKYTCF